MRDELVWKSSKPGLTLYMKRFLMCGLVILENPCQICSSNVNFNHIRLCSTKPNHKEACPEPAETGRFATSVLFYFLQSSTKTLV